MPWPSEGRRWCSAPASQRPCSELAESLPGEHRIAPADLAEEGAAERLAADAGEVDCLVANAGLPGTGVIEGFSPEEVERALRVNLEAPIMLARELAPGMSERGERAPRVRLLARRQGSQPALLHLLRRPSSGCAASRSACAPTWPAPASASRSSLPGFIRDAGMFADSGAKPPPGLGTSTPEQVAAGVVRAIERDKVEVAVAPLRQRALAHLGLASPRSRCARSPAGRKQDRGSGSARDRRTRDRCGPPAGVDEREQGGDG